MELGAENAGSARGGGLAELLQRRPLLGDNHLDDEVVLDAHSALAVYVAKWLETDIAGSHELNVDLALLKVRLPSGLDFLVGNGPNVFVKHTLALTTDLVHVLCASRSDELLSLLNAPVELSQSPACLGVRLVLDNARQAHLNGEIANGVDDRG